MRFKRKKKDEDGKADALENPPSFFIRFSDIEPEVHNVSILHHIVFALDTQFSGLAHGSFRTVSKVIFIFNHFGSDESFLKVGVDNACTLRSLPASMVSPGLDFHLAGGDKRLEVEQRIGLFDESIHAAFLQSQFL